MARRRRRSSRRRSRRRGPSIGLVIGVFVAVLVLLASVAGVVLYQSGAWEGISVGSGPVVADSSRFKGAEGIVIPEADAGASPGYWWSSVTSDTVTAEEGYLTELDSGAAFERLLVPVDLLFEADSAQISREARESLRGVAEAIADPSLRVVVVCHSSADGPEESRLPLSERRADSLASALEQMIGRDPRSIVRIGKGDSVPLPGIDQTTPSGLALNRRCEIFVEFG